MKLKEKIFPGSGHTWAVAAKASEANEPSLKNIRNFWVQKNVENVEKDNDELGVSVVIV